MKTFKTSLLIVFITAFILGCTSFKESSTKVIVLLDITDKLNSLPAPNDIFGLFDFQEKSMWDEKEFQYSTISDVSYNRQTNLSLPKENKWFGNEIKRKKDIEDFKAGIKSTLTLATNDMTGRKNSSVYFPLTESLVQLSSGNATEKILVLYSDLMQNGNGLSFYEDATYAILKNDPASVEKKINANAPLPVLQGIDIYIIYHPVSSEDDERFTVVSSFYKNILEKKGATVHIQANL